MPCYGLLLYRVCLFQTIWFAIACIDICNHSKFELLSRACFRVQNNSQSMEARAKFNQLARCSDYVLVSGVFRKFVETRAPTDVCVLGDSAIKCYPNDNHIVAPEERAAN